MYSKWIKEKRIEKKLSQKQLAKLIEVSNQTICNYEKGLQHPRQKTYQKLVEVLGQPKQCVIDDKAMREIERLSKDLYEYVKQNLNPYTSIVIGNTGVQVVNSTLFIPLL